MNSRAPRPTRTSRNPAASGLRHSVQATSTPASFADHRPSFSGQERLQLLIDSGPRARRIQAVQEGVDKAQARTNEAQPQAASEPTVQRKPSKTYRESSRAREVYGGNEWVYRHMILQSLHEYFRHFIQEEWELNKGLPDVITAHASYQQAIGLLELETQEGGAVTDERNERVKKAWYAAIAGLDALVWGLMTQDEQWLDLDNRGDILSGDPPLTESSAKAALTLLEQGKIKQIQNVTNMGSPYQFPKSAREQEWGVLKRKGGVDECKLVFGDATGVSWPKQLLDCGIAIAHSHPYFKSGKPRDKRGGVSTATKEIADHPGLPPGAIAWKQIDAKENADIRNEISKTFPSASDIEFSGKHQVGVHTVFTPYAVLDNPTLGKCIVNPDWGMKGLENAPRLVFLIENAVKADDNVNYKCTLKATANGATFWTMVVTTDGLGQFGLLRW